EAAAILAGDGLLTKAFEAAECCGLSAKKALKTAAALEMIHTYSLIHDDLPAMDDDDLRRGKPTNHKAFGEAAAILAGDGLLTKAFEAAAENAADLKLKGREAAELIRLIAYGAGAEGMVGGQVADLAAEGLSKRLPKAAAARILEAVHRRKTGALIVASLDAGAVLAGAAAARRAALRAYGECVGLAFQIADDVLDVVGDKKKLGKLGSDRDNDKLTYAALYGLDGARAKARALIEMAHAHLKGFGRKAETLHELADYIIERDQ
ncbi:MAG: polyprenyl synthetase family protein, partial [Elusimicrobia bacterium]|nr:polyprenyl synthetase family protein [Elusimicrobiota bacterium]